MRITLTLAKQNDCALLIDGDSIKLVETALGWMFRQLSATLGEEAAVQYFRRLASRDQQQLNRASDGLRKALGSNYETYEVLVDFIHEEDLRDIDNLGNGRYGRVFSAMWNRPKSIEGREQSWVPVALKFLKPDSETTDDLLSRFLTEVQFQR
jgi:hypothetical protein